MKGIIAICIATLVSITSANLSYFPGKFKLTSNPNAEDYQEFMAELGYAASIRAAYGAAKLIDAETSVSGNVWTVTVKVDGNGQPIQFEFGKEFEDEMADGRKAKSKIMQVGDNQLVYTQKIVGGPTVTNYEEASNEGLKMTHECNGKKAWTTWKRL